MNAIRYLRALDWRCDICIQRNATHQLLDESHLKVAQVCDTCLEVLVARYTANGFTVTDSPVSSEDPTWNTNSTPE